MFEIQERAVILKGPFKDLSDILRIARHQGKRIFKVKKVRVNPIISYVNEKEIIVKVSPQKNNNENYDVEF